MHMVTHISDWVIVMAEGRVVAEGPPETVMKDPAVIDAYLGAHHDEDLGDLMEDGPNPVLEAERKAREAHPEVEESPGWAENPTPPAAEEK
jgi:branched-chain amino acid transport system ATP-binding protein